MSRKLPTDLTPNEMARFTEERWRELNDFYAMWANRWKRSIDFIRSLHWNTLRLMDVEKIPEWRRFPIVNFTLATYGDFMNQFMQSKVRFSAVPDNPRDSKSVSAAELADDVLRYLWDKLDIDTLKIDLSSWLMSTGNGAMRAFWNTNTGDSLPLAVPVPQPDGSMALVPVNPETLMPDPTMQSPIMVDAGEIGLEVLSPMLTRWPINKAHGVMVGYTMTYDEALEKFGKDVAENLKYNRTTGPLTTDFLSFTPTPQPNIEETALIIEHYLPRSSRFNNGLWWISSGQTPILKPMDLPTRYVPVVNFRWIPHPGHSTMGISPLYDISFSNKAYEELLARTLEWTNRVVPKMVRQSGDGLPLGFFNDEPAQEVVVAQGFMPAFINPPAPPEQFFRLRSDMADDIASVGGYKFNRQQQMPPGEATQRLRNPVRTVNEGQQVALAIINSETSWKQLGYVLLDYVSRFYTEPRVISVVGQDSSYQWREFKGSDLDNLPATLHIDKQSLYTWNRQSLRDTVIAVLNSPAANVLFVGEDGQLDKDRVNAAMSAAGIDVAPEALDMDIVEAKNEHVVFQGLKENEQPPVPESWQNNAKHYAEHVKVLKSVSFKQGWSPLAQDAFKKHVDATQQLLAQAAQAQEQNTLDKEKQLRDIRAAATTSQDVRTALGEKLVDVLLNVIVDTGKNTPPTKKGT